MGVSVPQCHLFLISSCFCIQGRYYVDLTLFLASDSLNSKVWRIARRGEFLTLPRYLTLIVPQEYILKYIPKSAWHQFIKRKMSMVHRYKEHSGELGEMVNNASCN